MSDLVSCECTRSQNLSEMLNCRKCGGTGWVTHAVANAPDTEPKTILIVAFEGSTVEIEWIRRDGSVLEKMSVYYRGGGN